MATCADVARRFFRPEEQQATGFVRTIYFRVEQRDEALFIPGVVTWS